MLRINSDLTAEQRLTKAVVAIMGKDRYVALSGILMIGTRNVVDTPEIIKIFAGRPVFTACTNGRDEKYGREFIELLTDAMLRYLVLHENYHKLYKHLDTWKVLHDENPYLANCSCDYVINLKISNDNTDGFAVMPVDENGKQMGLLDTRFEGMNSGQVFKILKEEAEDNEDEDGDEGGGSTGDGPPQNGQPGGGKGTSNGVGNKNATPGDGDDDDDDTEGSSEAGTGTGGTGFDEHDWDGAESLTESEKRALDRDIDEGIRQGALLAGSTGSGNGEREFGDLLKAQIPYQEVLREFMNENCVGNDLATYRRPNRRFMSIVDHVYLPSAYSERIGDVCVEIDNSGSIGDDDLRDFMSEFKFICDTLRPHCVRVLYWDTEVVHTEVYRDEEVAQCIETTRPRYGGGTDVRCVAQYLQEKNIIPQVHIVFTDGYLYGGWGDKWNAPLLWVIKGNRKDIPTVGKYVYLKNEVGL